MQIVLRMKCGSFHKALPGCVNVLAAKKSFHWVNLRINDKQFFVTIKIYANEAIKKPVLDKYNYIISSILTYNRVVVKIFG